MTQEVKETKETREDKAKPIVFLRGKRVVLRPILREDISLILRWINDPEVTQYLKTYLPKMEANENEWINNLHKETDHNIMLMIVVEEKPIGIMGFNNIDWKDRIAITGAFIGEKEYWGKGYGTDAKMVLLDYAFNILNLRKICSSVICFNERSHAYLVKCGYVQEGTLAQQVYFQGRYWDEIIMAVFKENFMKLWEEYQKS